MAKRREGARERGFVRGGLLLAGFSVLAAGIWGAPQGPKPKQKAPARQIEFNRDIRPIITKCFTCHGHDPKAIMADLRLDQRSAAISKLKDGHIAIVPGHPEQSEVVKRIYAKGDEAMPPAGSNKFITDEDRRLLTLWIK